MKLVNLSSVVRLTRSEYYEFISIQHELLMAEKVYYFDGSTVHHDNISNSFRVIDGVTGYNVRYDCINGKKYRYGIKDNTELSGITGYNAKPAMVNGK